MSKNVNRIRVSLVAGVAALATAGAAYGQQQLDQALQIARQSTQEGARTQEQIDDIADQASNLERQYIAQQEVIEGQRVFVEQQRVFLQSQENELRELNSQLERVGSIERDLTPMILEMFVRLQDFVEQDLPFQLEARRDRLANIEETLGNAQVPPAEKYRLILNAYEIESASGRSLRSYSEEVIRDGDPQEARILQVGRVALIRRFPDGSMEMQTKANPEWRSVPGSFSSSVQRALRIADEVTTPEVFVAPLPGPSAQ
ncbi:MAG: DUF3450 domain-containing protein [Pseudomonadota bacterium]